MFRVGMWFVVAVMAAAIGDVGPVSGAEEKFAEAYKEMGGIWALKECLYDGAPYPYELKVKLEFEGKVVRGRWEGYDPYAGDFRLLQNDEGLFHFTFAWKDDEQRQWEGTLRRTDDVLELCFCPDPSLPRPRDLNCPVGSKRWYYKLVRK